MRFFSLISLSSVVVFAVMVGAIISYAHTTGATIEQRINGYLIDIGYSAERIAVNTTARFDFLLFDEESGQETEFSDVWLRLERGEQLVFAGGLSDPYFGNAGMSIRFTEPGDYTAFVRYQRDSESLVETEFPFVVEPEVVSFWDKTVTRETLAISLGVMAVVSMALTFFGLRLTSKSSTPTEPKKTVPSLQPIWTIVRWRRGSNLLAWRSIASVLISVGIGCLLAIGLFFLYQHSANLRQDIGQWLTDTSTTPSAQFGSVSVVLTDSGFEPRELTIEKGTEVVFSTTAGRPYWPASNLHPTHEIYSAFDPQRALAPEETWSFVFERVGTWNMHDHIRAYYTGTIHVVEPKTP